jgi:hypothetical protein
MSLKEELTPYTDGNGLVAPYLVTPGTMRASDNGPLFTSQAVMLSHLNGEYPLYLKYFSNILACIDGDGYIRRAPGDTTEDAPDDHYGVLSALVFFGVKCTRIRLPLRCWHPVLLFLWMLNAPILTQILLIPIRIITTPLIALIIATSNARTPIDNTSNRLLSWCFVTALSRRSLLCELAGKIWLRRLRNDYGGDEAGPARIYFQLGHPFVRYWRNI